MSFLRIRPFVAVCPRPEKASQVASVPYDVVDTAEARRLAEGKPLSFLHVVRSEIDLPESVGPYDDAVYARARENFRRLLDEGVLVRDEKPGMFIYRLVGPGRDGEPGQMQFGLVCCCHVDDYMNDVIKKHEKTRQDKEDDRTRHILELNAHAEPVFLTYRERGEIDGLVARDINDRPLFHFNAPDGVTHTVWRVSDARAYVEAFADVPVAYIADGHHRSASAARAGAERRAGNANHTGEEEYNWFLAVLFPHTQLRILPYNRVVRDLAGKTAAQVLDALAGVGALERGSGQREPERAGSVCVYLDGGWHTLRFAAETIDYSDPIGSLDVALLQERVLGPVFGIGDPRTDERIDFVGGIRGVDELERRVDSGRDAAAFSMYATSIEQLLEVADAGLVMPPKSTWFEPKLRSGLFVHEMEG